MLSDAESVTSWGNLEPSGISSGVYQEQEIVSIDTIDVEVVLSIDVKVMMVLIDVEAVASSACWTWMSGFLMWVLMVSNSPFC